MNAQRQATGADPGGDGPHMANGFFDTSHGILSADKVLDAIKTHGYEQFKATLSSIWGDKLFIAFLALSMGGFGYLGLREFTKLKQYQRRLRQEDEARKRALQRFKALEEQQRQDAANNSSTDLGEDVEAQQQTPPAPTTAPTTTTTTDKKKRTTSHRKGGLIQKLKRLLSIAIPSPTSYTAQILIAQFCLLVTRTFLSINCAKNSITAITKAISGASWKWWVRWLTNFSMWMCGGIVVNSGLRFGEQLLALQIRSALTQHIHKNYFKGINYYRVNSAPAPQGDNKDQQQQQQAETPTSIAASNNNFQSPPQHQAQQPSPTTTKLNTKNSPIAQVMNLHVSGVENRVVRDVANFSENIAFLYGHSFKPILEFTLSLTEASSDLGFKRPLALFGVSVLINLAMRSISPHLGRMISIESENEGQLQQAHTRIASHAEEIAFMQGGRTEEVLIHDKLQQLLYTKIKHNLLRIYKSVGDNIVKFSGLLVGGVFVHIPYLLSTNHTSEQRMSGFRGTEEVMMRCGSAFSEILLLGKELQEVGGHCDRILDVFDALDQCNKQHNTPDVRTNTNPGDENDQEHDVLVYTSQGVSVHRPNPASASHAAAMAANKAVGMKRTLSGVLIDNSLSGIDMKQVTVVPPEDHPAYVQWYLETEDKRAKNEPIAPFGGRILIGNLNLHIPRGKSVLITGPNGSGKTSLFRCLAGLWPIASGYLYRPSGGVMLVPQNPYLIFGSLRDNVTYPILYRLYDGSKESNQQQALYGGEEGAMGAKKRGESLAAKIHKMIAENIQPDDHDTTATIIANNHIVYTTEDGLDKVDQDVQRAMELACGAKIIKQQSEGLYTVCQWDGKLSGGERQKVGLARVFYHKPVYALLDEATSAVHPRDEGEMYANVTKAGITIFSIAHRPALRDYHQIELVYTADGLGGYQVHDLPQKQ